jgi:hypothetical protein
MTVEIDSLDRALARSGQTVTLRRLPNIEVVCPAIVRGYTPNELVGSITQHDSLVILSPTQINAAVWPGVQGAGEDIRIPNRNRGDLIDINGKTRTVQAGVGIYIGTVLVRIELQVR